MCKNGEETLELLLRECRVTGNESGLEGHQKCMTYDVINVKPCFKCGRIGHSAAKCRNADTCLKCAGNHVTKGCRNELVKCTNFVYSNLKYKTEYNVNHTPTDHENCKILKSKVNKFIDFTDYPMAPAIPKYLGKADFFKKKKQNRILTN